MIVFRAVTVLLLIPIAVIASRPALAQPAAVQGRTVTVQGGSYLNIGATTLREMLARKHFFLVNVHVPYEGEIEGTDVNVPFDLVEQRIDQLPSDRSAPILVYCRSGRMSTAAANMLV